MIYLLLDGAVKSGSTRVETPGKTLHLKALPGLLGLKPEDLDVPTDLRKLGDRNIKARRLLTRIMIRAAMMHTRIALEPPSDDPADAAPAGATSTATARAAALDARRATAVLIRDGRQTRIPNRSVHWAIARAALDIDGPPRAASDTAKLWYHASASYMQQEREYSSLIPHLQYARDLFTTNPLYFLFSGAAYENLAAPRVQAAVDEADGTVRSLGTPAELWRQADRLLLQALALDPDFALAQLRRGRVLNLLGRNQEAVIFLRKADSSLTDPSARYLANLFLGKAEQALRHNDEARAAYERAMSLWPAAQSPKLALATMSWLSNDRAQAGAGVRQLSAIDTEDTSADPFWTYDALHIGDVPAMFERLRVMAIEATK